MAVIDIDAEMRKLTVAGNNGRLFQGVNMGQIRLETYLISYARIFEDPLAFRDVLCHRRFASANRDEREVFILMSRESKDPWMISTCNRV